MSRDGTTRLAALSATLPPPTVNPARSSLPVLLSIAHAGRDYPDWLLARSWAGREALQTLEDPLVDRLAWRAMARGVAAVVAHCPRAAIDCNRAEEDLDPAVIEGVDASSVGPRARAGLGLIPSRTPLHGALWRRPIGQDELGHRLDQAHRPFHSAIARELDVITLRYGGALLLDLHSMPSRGGRQAQVVIGDRHGTSAGGWVAAMAARLTRGLGFSVALNDPFAGGHTVTRHGRPADGVHALQIEVDRSTYCLRDGRTPGPGFERVATLFDMLALELGEAMRAETSAAAE
jgi:N-formylglutamate amidohydrolase